MVRIGDIRCLLFTKLVIFIRFVNLSPFCTIAESVFCHFNNFFAAYSNTLGPLAISYMSINSQTFLNLSLICIFKILN